MCITRILSKPFLQSKNENVKRNFPAVINTQNKIKFFFILSRSNYLDGRHIQLMEVNQT